MKPFLEKIAKGIAAQFGENCEVAIHNLTGSYENTIELIENGHVTGRRVGDGASEVALEALKQDRVEDHYRYITHSKDGRLLKSTTIFIPGEDGGILGTVSINYDVTDLAVAGNTISDFLKMDRDEGERVDVITNDVGDLLDNLIEESWKYIGKPISAMTKEEKIRAIRYLDSKGAFLIMKSGEKIARYYDISKYTLYNYLGAGQKEPEQR
jgi:predicted transcriptional regulator YheO